MQTVKSVVGSVGLGLLLNFTAMLFDKPVAAFVTRWGWLLLILYVTWVLLSVGRVRKGAVELRSLFGRHTVFSYAIAAFIFASVGIVYWASINAAYSRLVPEAKPTVPTSSSPQPSAQPSVGEPQAGPAITYGDNSPAVTGSGNKVTYGATPKETKPSREDKQ
jgi:hypothetical protein